MGSMHSGSDLQSERMISETAVAIELRSFSIIERRWCKEGGVKKVV